jgi:predicted DsbA family dithiol-disulfide isomerase
MTVLVTHYSDLLCVWAYVGERKLAELKAQFGDQVALEHRFCSVFGDAHGKIAKGWGERGGFDGFADHVHEVAGRFDMTLHADLWRAVRPTSSDCAHLVVKACQLAEAEGAIEAGAHAALATALREAFFVQGRDISSHTVRIEVAGEQGLPTDALLERLECGAAHAALAHDAQDRERLGVKGSPTLLLNEGRQKLYGNVGYRVLEANVEELLRAPTAGEASWC